MVIRVGGGGGVGEVVVRQYPMGLELQYDEHKTMVIMVINVIILVMAMMLI